MNKAKLKKIILNSNKNDLYESIVFDNEDKSDINRTDFQKAVVHRFYSLAKFYRIRGFSKVIEKFKFEDVYPKDEKYSFNLFYKAIINKGNEYYKEVVLKLYNYINSSKDKNFLKLSNPSKKDDKFMGQINLAVDNKDIYKLLNVLLDKFDYNQFIEYDIIVNANTQIHRNDDIIIYFNKNNFKFFIDIVNEAIKDSKIKLREPNYLSYNIGKKIGVEKYIPLNKESLSKSVCKKIEKYNGKIDDLFLDNLEKSVNISMKEIISLVEGL